MSESDAEDPEKMSESGIINPQKFVLDRIYRIYKIVLSR